MSQDILILESPSKTLSVLLNTSVIFSSSHSVSFIALSKGENPTPVDYCMAL